MVHLLFFFLASIQKKGVYVYYVRVRYYYLCFHAAAYEDVCVVLDICSDTAVLRMMYVCTLITTILRAAYEYVCVLLDLCSDTAILRMNI